MRKFALVAVFLLLCGTFAMAQKAELGAGWNYLHFDNGGAPGVDSSFPAGFFVDGTYYFAKIIGLAGDFEYNKHTFPAGELGDVSVDASALSFHAGPRVKVRMGKIEPFAHALFGFTRASGSGGGTSISDTVFSTKLGGGVDVGVAPHFAVRLGEFNYYMTRFNSASAFSFGGQDHQNNFTFSAGIVIR